MNKNGCIEIARMRLPWAGEILYYCPFHANQLASIAEAIGQPMKAELIPKDNGIQCVHAQKLTEEQKEISETFEL